LSRAVGIEKKFIDMTRDDVLCYLDKYRKSENEDPTTFSGRLSIFDAVSNLEEISLVLFI
jgi:hypothetical protein